MTSNELRQKFLDFFKSKAHKILPSASLIPENDPTVLFTTAGMHPLVPYLLGEKHPMGKRLANAQKCLRTDDIDEVGDETHLTFFEMMGNWSLGDYWKEEAIKWSWEFLTSKKWLGLAKDKLAVSVFAGDQDAPRDNEAAKIWQSLAVSKDRIAYLPKSENWWGPAGKTGPCGPDTEMFYWTGDKKAPAEFDPEDKNWVEIWNNVFMQYEKKLKMQNAELKNNKEEYEYTKLQQRNVDTGMGLERVTAILNNKKSVYEIDAFVPIINELKLLNPDLKEREMRIIADHIRASVFIMADRIEPSNIGHGYVLRRLIRKAMRYARDLVPLAKKIMNIYGDIYPEVNNAEIIKTLKQERDKFAAALEIGLGALKALASKKISGRQAFDIYQTYGLPLEIMQDEVKVNEKEFKKALEEHQGVSRKGAEKKFKAGLADHKEETVKLHTATHLLLSALREVLGVHVKQAGSNITPERLRFDFTHNQKLDSEQIEKIEEIVNQKIKSGLQITCCEMLLEEAEQRGALATFRGRYPDKVKVYTIGDKVSCEICAGPHIKNTSELGKFKIIKEESSSAGVRRIKAVLE